MCGAASYINLYRFCNRYRYRVEKIKIYRLWYRQLDFLDHQYRYRRFKESYRLTNLVYGQLAIAKQRARRPTALLAPNTEKRGHQQQKSNIIMFSDSKYVTLLLYAIFIFYCCFCLCFFSCDVFVFFFFGNTYCRSARITYHPPVDP
jgi:hypothetical protein